MSWSMGDLADSVLQGNRVFLLDPKNADVLTGERRTHYASSKPMKPVVKALIVLAGLFYVVLTVASVVWMVNSLSDWWALEQRGGIVQARLIDRFTELSRTNVGFRRTVTTYYWRYRFETADGQTIEGSTQVREALYQDEYEFGRLVQVVYLKDNPSVNRLVEEGALGFPRLAVVGGVFFALSSVFMVFVLSQEMRHRRLYHDKGRVIYGRVTTANLNAGESKGRYAATLYLNYSFSSPTTGKQINKFEHQRRDDLDDASVPREGTRVAILYVSDRLFKVL